LHEAIGMIRLKILEAEAAGRLPRPFDGRFAFAPLVSATTPCSRVRSTVPRRRRPVCEDAVRHAFRTHGFVDVGPMPAMAVAMS
ncbi:MAG: hypothetical protein ACRD15_16615, partial [Vicinamibacterales bacterium]